MENPHLAYIDLDAGTKLEHIGALYVLTFHTLGLALYNTDSPQEDLEAISKKTMEALAQKGHGPEFLEMFKNIFDTIKIEPSLQS